MNNKFHGTIVTRHHENAVSFPHETIIWRDYIDASSIQAAKAWLTRKANATELFSYIQSWDDKEIKKNGSDLRWGLGERNTENTNNLTAHGSGILANMQRRNLSNHHKLIVLL